MHLCGSRYVDRTEAVTEIKVYSNQPEVTLLVDGKLFASAQGKTVFIFHVPISGTHSIEAKAEGCHAAMLVRRVEQENPDYIFVKRSPVLNWFDAEAHDETCYSVSDTLGEIRTNPEAGAIIDRMMAQGASSRGDVADVVKDNPGLVRMMNRMTLISLLKQGGTDEESIKQINRILQGIKKTK